MAFEIRQPGGRCEGVPRVSPTRVTRHHLTRGPRGAKAWNDGPAMTCDDVVTEVGALAKHKGAGSTPFTRSPSLGQSRTPVARFPPITPGWHRSSPFWLAIRWQLATKLPDPPLRR